MFAPSEIVARTVAALIHWQLEEEAQVKSKSVLHVNMVDVPPWLVSVSKTILTYDPSAAKVAVVSTGGEVGADSAE